MPPEAKANVAAAKAEATAAAAGVQVLAAAAPKNERPLNEALSGRIGKARRAGMPPKAEAKGVAAKAKARAAAAGMAKGRAKGVGKGGEALPKGALRPPGGPACGYEKRPVACRASAVNSASVACNAQDTCKTRLPV